jgi:hypothetical protein
VPNWRTARDISLCVMEECGRPFVFLPSVSMPGAPYLCDS